jgi:hypothetical protein
MEISETEWRAHKERVVAHWRRYGINEIIISSAGFAILSALCGNHDMVSVRWRGFTFYNSACLPLSDPCHESRLIYQSSESELGFSIKPDGTNAYHEFWQSGRACSAGVDGP